MSKIDITIHCDDEKEAKQRLLLVEGHTAKFVLDSFCKHLGERAKIGPGRSLNILADDILLIQHEMYQELGIEKKPEEKHIPICGLEGRDRPMRSR